MRTVTCLILATCALASSLGCDDGDAAPERIYPTDWATSFVEVRGCRPSPDHSLENVALWIDPASKELFERCVVYDSTCTEVFPEGATFLKPQYADAACTDLVRLSIARKEPGFDDAGGWHWQEVIYDTPTKSHVSKDGADKSCWSCHATCDGSYDMRCVMDE